MNMFNSICIYYRYTIHLVFKFFSNTNSLFHEVSDLMAENRRVSYSAVGTLCLGYTMYGSWISNIVCLTMIETK